MLPKKVLKYIFDATKKNVVELGKRNLVDILVDHFDAMLLREYPQ